MKPNKTVSEAGSAAVTQSDLQGIINAVAEATARIGDRQLECQLKLAELQMHDSQLWRNFWGLAGAGLKDLIIQVFPVMLEADQSRVAARYQAEADRQEAQHKHEIFMQELKLRTAQAASGKEVDDILSSLHKEEGGLNGRSRSKQ